MEQTARYVWRSRTCNVGLCDLALADLSAKVDCPKEAQLKRCRFAIDNGSTTGQLHFEVFARW